MKVYTMVSIDMNTLYLPFKIKDNALSIKLNFNLNFKFEFQNDKCTTIT